MRKYGGSYGPKRRYKRNYPQDSYRRDPLKTNFRKGRKYRRRDRGIFGPKGRPGPIGAKPLKTYRA